MRLAIGDIHGRNYWKNYLHEDFSAFYILGDYFDSFNISFSRQCRNFAEICAAARRDSRIKLCLGNHDYHYLAGISERYSGFQEKHRAAAGKILEENLDLLKVLYLTEDNYIISHAGLSSVFMEKMRNAGVDSVEGINGAFVKDRNILKFDGGEIHGDDLTQSPIWIRPRSLCSSPLPGYNQIVGHTPKPAIEEVSIPDDTDAQKSIKIVFINTELTDMVYWF